MDSSNCCIEDACSDSDNHHPPPIEPLHCVGSGASVVVDPDSTGVESESRKLPSSQYKGVVPQPNGRWGAQIYEKHQRVWLGTFDHESDAAKGYDAAAQRFRGSDAVTNFKPLSESNESDIPELEFLNRHSKAEIVDMLRKHTYVDELHQSKRASCAGTATITKANRYSSGRGCREHLFDKTVTPSDVGKLNRLVIPKQHAEKHFSLKNELLNFEDDAGNVWRFRYSYWNSSQSYVLTRGWSRFVKEKRLEAGDVVSFQQSEKQLYIECKPRACRQVQVVRLFGVNIFKVPAEIDHVGIKRSKAMKQLTASPKFLIKKQCAGAL